MGLPSGLLWADRNIGASSPSEDGLYFSWGNTVGHQADSMYNFSQSVYNSTPGAAIAENLSLNQDAARANIGNPWRMPNAAEFQELYENCTSIWTTLNGVSGRLFTSNVNGKTLFFPASGYYNGTVLNYRGSNGRYWSSTYFSDTNANYLYLNYSNVSPNSNDSRRIGFTIRAVASPSNHAQSLNHLSMHEHLTDNIRNEGLDIQPIESTINSVTE